MLALGRASQIEVWTPAKLNLFLEVLGRRSDGYHELETVMTAISLYDTLQFRASDNDEIQLDMQWTWGQASRDGGADATLRNLRGEVPVGTGNLVVRALELLRTAAGVNGGAVVSLIKRIPSAAGLGGASSDAAGALWAGNIGWGIHWSVERLREVAAQIGSDVPFFLHARTALCRGRGEIITPLSLRNRWHVVVIRPPVGLGTAEVFRRCRVPEERERREWPRSRVQVTSSRASESMFNRLQFAAEELTPWIDHMRREFQRQQVLGHQLSGSGSCYFGVCHNRAHATHVARRLASDGRWRVFQGITDCAMHTRVREHCHN